MRNNGTDASPTALSSQGRTSGDIPQTIEAAGKVLQDQFTSFTSAVLGQFGELAGKDSSYVFLSFGPLMILIALATQFGIFGSEDRTFETAGFITVVGAGTLLMICGASIRLYNNYLDNAREVRVVQAGQQLFTSVTEANEATNKAFMEQMSLLLNSNKEQQEDTMKVVQAIQEQLQQPLEQTRNRPRPLD